MMAPRIIFRRPAKAGKLAAFALCLITLLHFADRIIAGAVQCPALEACPWH